MPEFATYLSPLNIEHVGLSLLVQQARHLEPQQFIHVLLIKTVRLRLSYEFFIEMEDRSSLQFLDGCLGKLLLEPSRILGCHALGLQYDQLVQAEVTEP